MAVFNVQKITTGNKTAVSFNNPKSMVFTNTHASAAITIDLYVTSQVGTDITNTGTDINVAYPNGTNQGQNGYAATTSSQAVVLSATAATSDAFLNERVYRSDGIFFGTCTTFTNGTNITFGGGIVKAMADADLLHTGTRYRVLNNVKIPNGSSLKLTSDELTFDNVNYGMYVDSDSATGDIDIITRF